MVHWIESEFWHWQLASDTEVSAARPSDFLFHPPQSPTDTLYLFFLAYWFISLFRQTCAVFWQTNLEMLLKSSICLKWSLTAVSHGLMFMCFTCSAELKVTLHTEGFMCGGGSFVHSAAWLPISASCCSPCLLHALRPSLQRWWVPSWSPTRLQPGSNFKSIWRETSGRGRTAEDLRGARLESETGLEVDDLWQIWDQERRDSSASSGSWRGE